MRGCRAIIGDLGDHQAWIDHLQVGRRQHANEDLVQRQDLLRGCLNRIRAHVDPGHPVDPQRQQITQPRPGRVVISPEAERDAAFMLVDHPQAGQPPHQYHRHSCGNDDEREVHCVVPLSGGT